MALSSYIADPFFDPFFALSVPSVSRELTRDDTGFTQGIMRPKCVHGTFGLSIEFETSARLRDLQNGPPQLQGHE
jgi:hypothetical protein